MKRLGYSLVFSLFVSVLAGAAAPPQPPEKFDLGAIDAYVRAVVQHKGLVGLSVAIMRDGNIVFAKGYGQRSLEKMLPVVPESSFAVGSITKQFTCACIFLLAEEKKLAIDDPVAKYFPHLTKADKITIRDLMNHVSGYPDYYPLDFVDRRMAEPIAFARLANDYAAKQLDFAPGSRYSYSNTGYIILGEIVSKVAGEPFGAFLDRRILKPLHLDHSRFGSAADLPLAATGYTSFALGPPEPAVPEASGWVEAAGGLWASAPDLLRWDLALTEGKVLKPASYHAMTTQRMLTSGKTSDYACGLLVSTMNGETVIRHTGGVSGFLSFNSFVPRARSGVVVLSNADHIDVTSFRTELLRLLFKDIEAREGPAVPVVHGPKPAEVVRDFLKQMTSGNVDRSRLGEEFSFYLTENRVKEGGARLKALGEVQKVEADPVRERGGMEVASVKLTFKSASVRASLYRTPDGKIQQLLFSRE